MPSALGESVLVLTTDQAPLNRGLAQARMNAERTGAQMQTTMDRRMASMGAATGRVGSAMTRNLTLPLVALAGASAALDAKFSQAMEMIHTQAGAPQKEVGALRDQVLSLARVVPQGPVALAESLFRIESVGFRGAKAMSALKASAQLAAVGNANLDDTTKALVQTVFTGIKGIGNFQQVVALLNATVGAGDMHLSDLVDALGQGILPAAKLAGLGLRDVLGAIAVFGDETKNVAGWTAQFATALHFLTSPTSKASTALHSMGLSTDQLAQDMHKPQGLLVALKDLRSHLDALPGGANGVKAEQTLGSILPGGRGRVLLVLLNQLDRYQQKLGQISRTTSQFSGDVAKTQQTDAFKIHTAWSNLEVDAVDIGHKVLPELLHVGEAIVGIADKAATAFSKLPKGMQDAIIAGGLIVAATGPALKLLGVFERGVGGLLKVAGIVGRGTGLLPQLTKLAGGSKLSSSVATMEVAEMNVAKMLGGGGLPGGAGGGAVSTAEGEVGGAGAGVAGAAQAAVIPAATVVATTYLVLKALGVNDPHTWVHTFANNAFSRPGPLLNGQPFPGTYGGINPNSWRVTQLPAGPRAQTLPSGGPRVINNTLQGPSFGMTGLTARGQQMESPKAIEQATRDYDAMSGALARLSKQRAGVTQTAATLSRLAQQAAKAGDVKWALADSLGAELVKTRSVTSAGVRSLIHEVDKLPPAARGDAEDAMLGMAQKLETAGRVPVGTTAKLAAEMLHSYKAIKDKGGQQFSQLLQSSTLVAEQLRQRIAHSTGKARDQALAALRQLQQGTAHLFSQMEGNVNNRTKAMAHDIQSGSQSAAQSAESNFGRIASAAGRAMNTGALAAQQGAKIIGTALNTMLHAFGQKPIPLAGLSAQDVVNWQKWWASGGQGSGSGIGHRFEQGGMYQIGRPGEPGRDTVPMSIGGTSLIAGPGETAMIATRHQRPEMEMWAREHGYGGLGDFFRRNDRPNYMARGGLLPGYGTGGYVYPLPPGTSMGRTDMGVDANMPVGAPIGPIGNARVLGINPNWYAGQPYMWWQLQSGPDAGKLVYLAEQIQPLASPGQMVGAHQAIARYAPSGTGIEMGWAAPGGATLAQSTTGYSEGQVTGAGSAFRSFLTGLSHGLITGGVSGMPAPKVTGSGTVAEIDRAAVQKMTDAANKWMMRKMAMVSPAGGTFAGGAASAGGQYNLGQLEAIWQGGGGPGGAIAHVAGAIALAESAGRNVMQQGQPYSTTGWGLWQITPGNSEPQFGIDQALLNPSNNARAAVAKWQGAGDNFTPWTTYGDGAYQHFMARGGLLGLGRLAAATGYHHHVSDGTGTGHHRVPKKRRRPPRHERVTGHGGHQHLTGIEPLREAMPDVFKSLDRLNSLIGSNRGDVAQATDLYQQTDSMFQARNPNLTYVVSQDKLGNPILPYIDWELGGDGWPFPDIKSKHAVNRSLGELTELHGWQWRIVHDYEQAVKIIRPLLRRVHRAIEHRKRYMRRLHERIVRNLKRLKGLQSQIKGVNKQKSSSGKSAQLKSLNGEVSKLHTENTMLGGSATSVGTGGEIGKLSHEISTLNTIHGNLGGEKLSTLGASGVGGDLGSAKVQLTTLEGQINELSPGALRTQLAIANAGFSGQSNQQLVSELQSKLQTEAQTIAIENAEISVLSPSSLGSLPAFGGSFAMGGVVPGVLGEPRTIIAHGGERVTPPGAEPTVYVVVKDGAVDPRKIEVIAEGAAVKVTRRDSRLAGRGLPGRGGGR